MESTAADTVRSRLIEALRTVYDPEIPVNIYELGLVYELNVDDAGRVGVKMTLTSPACPLAGSLPGQIEAKLKGIEGVTDAKVELVWDPPWTPERMSEAAKLQLGMLFDDEPSSRLRVLRSGPGSSARP